MTSHRPILTIEGSLASSPSSHQPDADILDLSEFTTRAEVRAAREYGVRRPNVFARLGNVVGHTLDTIDAKYGQTEADYFQSVEAALMKHELHPQDFGHEDYLIGGAYLLDQHRARTV